LEKESLPLLVEGGLKSGLAVVQSAGLLSAGSLSPRVFRRQSLYTWFVDVSAGEACAVGPI